MNNYKVVLPINMNMINQNANECFKSCIITSSCQVRLLLKAAKMATIVAMSRVESLIHVHNEGRTLSMLMIAIEWNDQQVSTGAPSELIELVYAKRNGFMNRTMMMTSLYTVFKCFGWLPLDKRARTTKQRHSQINTRQRAYRSSPKRPPTGENAQHATPLHHQNINKVSRSNAIQPSFDGFRGGAGVPETDSVCLQLETLLGPN